MSNRTLLLTTALLFGCVLSAAPALAQDADQDPPVAAEDEDAEEESTEVDEILVQGTRTDIITAAVEQSTTGTSVEDLIRWEREASTINDYSI